MLPNNLDNIVEKIVSDIKDMLQEQSQVIVAIDGRCAAGKTTLAGKLQKYFDCNVFHMDDFFLRPEQRTAERLSIPGENVDHERFLSEVLMNVKKQQAQNSIYKCDVEEVRSADTFTYRPYDCSTQQLLEPVVVETKKVTIVEGSYSCHNNLWEYYDLRIFMDVDPDVQLSRIKIRNGEEATKQFERLWIPLEEKYFKAFNIEERCHINTKN